MSRQQSTLTPSPGDLLAPPPGAPTRRAREGRRPRRRRWIAALLAALLVFPAYSYAQALTAPGNAPWDVRSVEWVRDHGGNSLVNAIENWYYTRRTPTDAVPPSGQRPAVGPALGASPGEAPAPIAAVGSSSVPGEGAWVAGRPDAAGRPAIYTTWFRPDPRYGSVVAGAAWIRAGDTTAHLVPGTRQPGGGWPGNASVPSADVAALVATFNSGWKMQDINGGFYLDGRTGRPLADGAASVVIDDHGNVTIGQWGRDVTLTPHVAAVRQNLALVVDGGRPVAGLADNATGLWGSAHNQLQYTWRSGIGTDAHGDLIYVAGDQMTLSTLAAAMVDAGVVRGMQLDIHRSMVTFASWRPGPGGTSPVPTHLLPAMPGSAARYLQPDQRDFFYLTLR